MHLVAYIEQLQADGHKVTKAEVTSQVAAGQTAVQAGGKTIKLVLVDSPVSCFYAGTTLVVRARSVGPCQEPEEE